MCGLEDRALEGLHRQAILPDVTGSYLALIIRSRVPNLLFNASIGDIYNIKLSILRLLSTFLNKNKHTSCYFRLSPRLPVKIFGLELPVSNFQFTESEFHLNIIL